MCSRFSYIDIYPKPITDRYKICRNPDDDAWDLETWGEVYNTDYCLNNIHLRCLQKAAEYQLKARHELITCPMGCRIILPVYTYSNCNMDALNAVMAQQNAKIEMTQRDRVRTESAAHLNSRKEAQLSGGAGLVNGRGEFAANALVLNTNAAKKFRDEERQITNAAIEAQRREAARKVEKDFNIQRQRELLADLERKRRGDVQ